MRSPSLFLLTYQARIRFKTSRGNAMLPSLLRAYALIFTQSKGKGNKMKGVHRQVNGHWRVNIMVKGERMTKVCTTFQEACIMSQYIREHLNIKHCSDDTKEGTRMLNIIHHNNGNNGDNMINNGHYGQVIDMATGAEQKANAHANAQANAQANIQTFNFPTTGQGVRIILRDGEPWFVAKDVCMILDLNNPRSSLALLDEDEKGVHTMDTLGGRQAMSVISEPGLYSLIGNSRKPEARTFKRWVNHEVLPTIRRTGSYTMPTMPTTTHGSTFDVNTTYVISQAYLAANESLNLAREQLSLSSDIIADLSPKAECFKRFLDAKGSITLTEAAKQFNMTAQALGTFLRSPQIKWLFKSMQGHNIPTKPTLEKGFMCVITRSNSQTGYIAAQGRITPKGMEALQTLMKARGEN